VFVFVPWCCTRCLSHERSSQLPDRQSSLSHGLRRVGATTTFHFARDKAQTQTLQARGRTRCLFTTTKSTRSSTLSHHHHLNTETLFHSVLYCSILFYYVLLSCTLSHYHHLYTGTLFHSGVSCSPMFYRIPLCSSRFRLLCTFPHRHLYTTTLFHYVLSRSTLFYCRVRFSAAICIQRA
jgi:hypothetical protein